eukprot:Rhum_TRINITY_DN14326_c22_g1::Rhum_TRINITY_DN14326_c22_g1_i1::g.85105::m.85105/K02736/PSMB4; 20S proteasome subunit beta 7
MSITNGFVALKYKDGVIVGADTQLHYGSFTKHVNADRHFAVGHNTTVVTGGYWADTQFLIQDLWELEKEDVLSDDGHSLTSAEQVHSYLKLVMYNKRCDHDPALISTVVVGKEKGEEPFLGWVDSVGSFAKADFFASGMANYLCTNLLREAGEDGRWKTLTKEDAEKVVVKCLDVMFLRARPACPRVQLSDTTDEGQKLGKPFVIESQGPTRGVLTTQQHL